MMAERDSRRADQAHTVRPGRARGPRLVTLAAAVDEGTTEIAEKLRGLAAERRQASRSSQRDALSSVHRLLVTDSRRRVGPARDTL